MSSIVRPCISLIGAAAILVGIGLAAGCARHNDTCNDVAKNICARLDQCQARARVFVDEQQCLDSFNGLFEVTNSDDARCRDEWTAVKNRDCPGFLDYFSI